MYCGVCLFQRRKVLCFRMHKQWRQKHGNLEGDGGWEIGIKGVTPSKTHQFWPICLLPMVDFAHFLSFLYFFSYFFVLPHDFRGDVPPTENFRGRHVPPSPPLPPPLCVSFYTLISDKLLLSTKLHTPKFKKSRNYCFIILYSVEALIK